MSVNPSLKPLLKRLLVESLEGSNLRKVAIRMLREIFLEEIEYEMIPFRGTVKWISPTKEANYVQEKAKEEV